MREELIVSGRNIPNIDPHLNIWHWPIPLYLFLGGLAAGLLFFAALYTIMGKSEKVPTAIKYGPFIAMIAIVIGLLALFYDLTHKLYFWRLYTTIRLASPMGWGAWTLLIVSILNAIWCSIHIKDVFPKWDWKYNWIKVSLAFVEKNMKLFAWILIIYATILGIYTGILLSAFNARPLWNTSILGPLFLASGLSAAAAFLMMITKSHTERSIFAKVDLIIIGIELFIIIHMIMGFRASTQVQIDAADLLLGGAWTFPFWGLVVFMGMIIPAILETLEMFGKKIPVYIPSLLILFGSLALRFIMVYAGQESRWLY